MSGSSGRAWAGRRLHFVGVGGAGMSGYARAAHALGAQVSGSDKTLTPYASSLAREGVLIARVGHRAENVPAGADVELVHSSAIPPENSERVAARERGLADHPRAELLSELTALRRTIAVAGAHGKTTTCSMIVHVLREAGLDPSWLVGSAVGPGLENSRWVEASSDGLLVVEADESDRSMLSLDLQIAVLTSVELDHHATFSSLEELRAAFARFLARAEEAVVIWDRPELLELLGEPAVEVVAYDVARPRLHDGGSRFDWRGHAVELTVPGAHNALDAAAALEVARLLGVERQACESIASFSGAARRFQRLGYSSAGALVIDDYAHHPTEVAATLTAARTLARERVVAVFQPHLYSRTALLAEEFGAALALADVIVLLDVYPARERAAEHPGVSGLTLVHSASLHADASRVMWAPDIDRAAELLEETLRQRDVCVVMGAGDVDALARRLVVSTKESLA